MNDEMFNELLESVKQAVDICKGKHKLSRYTVIEKPDVVAIREKYTGGFDGKFVGNKINQLFQQKRKPMPD